MCVDMIDVDSAVVVEADIFGGRRKIARENELIEYLCEHQLMSR
jgi:hypothetical protein